MSKTTVDSILTKEKYKGDALLQKSFTVDFPQKKMKSTESEVPQYYVEGRQNHLIRQYKYIYVILALKDKYTLIQTGGFFNISELLCPNFFQGIIKKMVNVKYQVHGTCGSLDTKVVFINSPLLFQKYKEVTPRNGKYSPEMLKIKNAFYEKLMALK